MKTMKRVFVVDSSFSAMFVSCLIDIEGIQSPNVLIEAKDGINKIDPHQFIIKSILKNHAVCYLQNVSVPQPYFLYRPTDFWIVKIFKLLRFRFAMFGRIKIHSGVEYIAPTSSSIALVATNVKLFDHGADDYLSKRAPRSILDRFKKLTFSVLGVPGLSYREPSFTPFPFVPWKKFVDLYNYRISSEIAGVLSHFNLTNRNIALVLLRSNSHTSAGLPFHDDRFDEFNLRLIVSHCGVNETLLLKYHPSVYEGGKVTDSLVPKCLALGYQCIDVDSQLPSSYRGQIPAELIVKFFDIKKIVSSGSATSHNLSHVKGISSIIDMTSSNIDDQAELQDYLLQLYKKLNSYIPEGNKISVIE